MPQLPSVTDATLDGEMGTVLGNLRDSVRVQIEAAFFWAAIVLPFLHVPLLLTGLDTDASLFAFVALLALNVVAVVVGHRYGTR